ncbi:MAG: helix-turn-helix domain-containing protein [Sphingobacteriaceae bacterium]
MMGPLLFYYVKNTVKEDKRFKPIDLLHFLPALLVVLNCLPFTTLPFSEKVATAHQIVEITEDYSLPFYWFSFQFLLYARSIHVIIYAIGSIFYLHWYNKKLLYRYEVLPSNYRIIQRWIYTLAIIQLSIAINSLGHMTTLYTPAYTILGIPATVIFSESHFFRLCGGGFLLQNFILFLYPRVLYGNISYVVSEQKEGIFNELKSNFPKKIRPSLINKEFKESLSTYLIDKPFTKTDFSLSQVSFDLKIPERILSAYFNQELNKTFSEWRNDLRIDYACDIIKKGAAKKLTIEAIATEAGFVSRSKFIDAFKARTGLTPSSFIKNLDA